MCTAPHIASVDTVPVEQDAMIGGTTHAGVHGTTRDVHGSDGTELLEQDSVNGDMQIETPESFSI